MTDQEGISKMETVDVEKEQERFEAEYQKLYTFRISFERLANGDYWSTETQQLFTIWLAAKKQTVEELEPLDTIYQWRSKPRNQPKRVFTGPWHNCSHVGYVALRENKHPRWEYETRILYAKKGE